MNKYLFVFAGFMLLVFTAYLGTRADFDINPAAGELEESQEDQQVFVKKIDNKIQKSSLLKDIEGEYFLGNKHAPVLMIEYASLSCPHCANFHEQILDPLMESHINTGKLKYIYRDFPLNAPALAGSLLANCAGEKRYFSFLKVLFKSQSNWAFSKNYKDVLRKISNLGGIDNESFEKCLADKEQETKILQVKKDAIDILEIGSTPTIFINGLAYQGKMNYEEISKYIDQIYKGTAK